MWTFKSAAKSLALSTALGAIAIASTGCSRNSDAQSADTRPLKVGMSFQELNNPYFVTMRKALEDAARSVGATVVVTDASHDVTRQISDVEDMIQQKVDILLVNPTDSSGIQSAIVAANAAKIPVVAIDANAAGPVDGFVGSKNFDAGRMSCDYLAKAIGGRGEVAILDGIAVVPILERVRGCRAALANHPQVRLVTVQNGKQERDVALSVTENMIQSHPNLRGIFSVNDGGSMGVLSAIEASGRDIKLTSVDGAPEAVQAIARPGSKFVETSAQFPADMVRIGLAMAMAKKWGATIPKEVPLDVKMVDAAQAKTFRW